MGGFLWVFPIVIGGSSLREWREKRRRNLPLWFELVQGDKGWQRLVRIGEGWCRLVLDGGGLSGAPWHSIPLHGVPWREPLADAGMSWCPVGSVSTSLVHQSYLAYSMYSFKSESIHMITFENVKTFKCDHSELVDGLVMNIDHYESIETLELKDGSVGIEIAAGRWFKTTSDLMYVVVSNRFESGALAGATRVQIGWFECKDTRIDVHLFDSDEEMRKWLCARIQTSTIGRGI